MNISACIITNNNPKVIEAIKSVKNCCNEIILVETSGRNDFQNELNNLGVQLYWKPFNDNFSEIRNFALQFATGDFILIIDSDEILKTEIKYIDDSYDFYFAKIYNLGLSYYLVRLFRNNIGLKFVNMIHENVNIKGYKGALSNIEIEHNGYTNKDILDKKFNRNLRILQKDTANKGQNYYFMCCYYYTKEIETAIQYGVNCLNDEISKEIKANACLMLYDLYSAKQDYKTALEYLSKSLEYLPYQSRGRIQFINELIKHKRKEDLITELNNLMFITKNQKSFLPNDVFLTETEISDKLKEANLIN